MSRTRCKAKKGCKHKARFYVTNDGNLRMRCCGTCLIGLVRKLRKPVGRGYTAIFIQKYNPEAP